MREIKFRVYSTINKPRMIGWDELVGTSTDCLRESDEWKVMQFTGLQDSEGVDVYEGNIVDARTPGFYDELVRYQIVFDKELSSFMAEHIEFIEVARYEPESDEDRERWRMDSFSEITIIGNIYENPELIDQ